jgi:hypothetical protein
MDGIMKKTFLIEDLMHAEIVSEHHSMQEAWKAVEAMARAPWGRFPNIAPCSSSETCCREYEIIEYDTTVRPYHEIRRVFAFEISAKGIEWGEEAPGALIRSIESDA